MMYQFCAIDLNLYLDNFPDDKNAREDYKKVTCKFAHNKFFPLVRRWRLELQTHAFGGKYKNRTCLDGLTVRCLNH